MPDSSLSCSKEPERKRVASDIPSGQWFGGGVRLHGTVAFEGPDPPFLLLHDKERQPQGGYFTFRSMPSIIEHRRSPGEDQTTGRTAPRCPRNLDRPVRTRPAPAASHRTSRRSSVPAQQMEKSAYRVMSDDAIANVALADLGPTASRRRAARGDAGRRREEGILARCYA